MAPPRTASVQGQAGFTIIETMVALALLLVGMAATLAVITHAASTTVETRTREQATNLQRELTESARSVSYDELTPNGLGTAVRGRPGLANSVVGPAGWTIPRRGAMYTVSMSVCTVDDPRDGTGAHEAGVFCAASGPPPTAAECEELVDLTAAATLAGSGVLAGLSAPQLDQLGQCGIDANLDGTVDGLVSTSATVCTAGACTTPADTNPADYKRIVSLVRWPGGFNLQTSQINNPGVAAAPAVLSLTPSSTDPITNPSTTSLGLTATTSNAPATVGLYLDGTAIAPAFTKGATNWTSAWNLGPVSAADSQPASSEIVDGSYQLSAKAFDQYGQYGATRTQTMVVNRRAAFAPANVIAGRNGSHVEIEWSPPKERDSAGFRVDRRRRDAVGPGSWVEVCARAIRTTCRDTGAPAPDGLSTLEYSVVGYDLDPDGALRAGARSAVQAVDPALLAPNQPGSLQASLVGGNVVLTWTAPSGDTAPDHYNIYRGGQSYADRFESVYITPGQPLRYTDTRTLGAPHDYWITAVNARLGESAKLGPVTR